MSCSEKQQTFINVLTVFTILVTEKVIALIKSITNEQPCQIKTTRWCNTNFATAVPVTLKLFHWPPTGAVSTDVAQMCLLA